MPKKAPSSPASTEDIEKVLELLDSRLTDADSLGEEIVGLREAVEILTKSVETLGQIVDDLRGDFEWALHNPDKLRTAAAALTVTSMPKDPLAADFGERINRYSADDLPPELREPAEGVPASPTCQPDLF